MERPEPGPAEVGAGSPEAPGPAEPDGPRRLREAVSAALPVGKKEVENMIQKNQCLFTSTQCKVCCALLISESQKLAHYQSKKHANRVKRYLLIHGLEPSKGGAKTLDSEQGMGSRDQSRCCPLCSATFSSPAVARSHYLGKTHARNLKLKQLPPNGEALSKRLTTPSLAASQTQEAPAPDQFCSICHAAFNDPAMAQQHYQGKKHRKQETKLRLMAHYGRLAGPGAIGSSAGKGYPCRTCKIVLNSIEQYQAHVSGSKHKSQSPKTAAAPPTQSPTQDQPLEKDSATLEKQRVDLTPQGGKAENLGAPGPCPPRASGWASTGDSDSTSAPRAQKGSNSLEGQPGSPMATAAQSSLDPATALAELS